MAELTVEFIGWIVSPDDAAGDESHLTWRVTFNVATEGEATRSYYADLKQVLGQPMTHAGIAVGSPVGYRGPWNQSAFEGYARLYIWPFVTNGNMTHPTGTVRKRPTEHVYTSPMEVTIAVPRDPEETRSITYRVMQYMDHLNDADFAQRVCDLFSNVLLDTPSDVLLNPPQTGWESLWRDAIDEASLRYGKSVAHRVVEAIKRSWGEARFSHPPLKRVKSNQEIAAIIREVTKGEPFLVRYGERKYLEPFVTHGRLRVCPATHYDDASINPAIRDKELDVTIQPHGLIAEVIGKTGKSKGRLPIIESRLTSTVPDYYVHCLSGLFSTPLFSHFHADACVIIWDPKLYIKRILDGLHAVLPYPAWAGDIELVRYIDPLNAGLRQFDVRTAKDFHFACERERRIIWVRQGDSRPIPLEYLNLELGSMEDCCTLLVP